ncbi:hypothetical protein FKP32DRAFT_1013146 [Trametes sanguinea]|nr:hypothetical protein FKP32DRAFT_1013146 [Trametes sanguinea]
MPSESHAELIGARMSYAAAVLACMTYGAYFVLAVICIHFLLKRRAKANSQRVILAYTIVMLLFTTGYFVSGAMWSEIEFVESANNIAEYASSLNQTLAIVKDTFYILNIWLADSLLIYRLHIVWGGSFLVIILPIFLWMGAVATGVILLLDTAKPTATLVAADVIHFQTAFYCMSISLNIFTTLLIAGRLWYQQRQMKALTAVPSARWDYTSVIAIFVESAALYSICGIVYIPLVVRQLPLQYPITALIGAFTAIAPSLIILRIALGTAVTQETTAKTGTIIRLGKLRSGFTASTAVASAAGQSTSAISGELGSKVHIADTDGSWNRGVIKPGYSTEDVHSAV